MRIDVQIRRRSCLCWLAAASVLMLGVLGAHAQNGAGANSPQDVPVAPVQTEKPSYAVSLGTGELINRNADSGGDEPYTAGLFANRSDVGNRLFYGASVSTFYTNAFTGVPNQDLISTSVNPYLGVLVPTKTGSYVIQYNAIVDPKDSSGGGPQAYHTVGFSAEGAFTRRLSWSFDGGGSYGSESARVQGPLSYLAISGAPIADTSSAAVLFRAKNVAFGAGSLGLGWMESSRNRIGMGAFYTYSGIQGTHITAGDVGSHDNAAGTRIDFTRTVSSRLDVRAYGQFITLLNGPTCNSVGGGLGISVKVTRSVQFQAQGGPEHNSISCGGTDQTVDGRASLVAVRKNGDRIYAMGGRVFTTAYRVGGSYEDDATAGLSKNFRRLNVVAEAGYLRGEFRATSLAPYRGYFISPRIRYKLTDNLAISSGYRTFRGTGGELVTGNLSFAVATIEWYPAAIRIK